MNAFTSSPTPEPKTAREIANLCAAEIEDARDNDRHEHRDSRERALAYFLGDMDDTPAEEGRSSAKTSDTADVVEWMLPGLERLFFGSARIVDYQPDHPDDEEPAEQASEYVNYIMERDGEGRAAMKSAMHDGLVVRKGILKAWWSDEVEYKTESYSGLTDDTFAEIVGDPDVEVIAHTAYEGEPEPQMDPQTGQPVLVPVALHNVKLRRVKRAGKVKIAAIPPEDFFINEGATTIGKARFLCHRDRLTRTELVDAGYDYDQVMNLPRMTSSELSGDDELELTRDQGRNTLRDLSNDASTDEIEVFECYILADFDGDGLAEWNQVVLAGGFSEKNIMAIEEWGDPLPFASLDPMPVPHRWVGRGVADSTMDIQQIKTVLQRQTLDNIYEQNHPQKVVVEKEIINADAVINPRFNGVIRIKGTMPAQAAVSTIVPTFIADTSFSMMSYLDQTLEKRTGVSRSTMALDPEALQNQTAEAVRAGKDAQYSKVELIARNYAQGGFRDFFRIILKLVVSHQDRPEIIRLRNKWVEMDPRSWNAEMDVTINTGLGTGSRERDLAMLMQIYGAQKELLMTLFQVSPQMALKFVPLSKLYNTLDKMVIAAGLRDGEEFFGEISDEELEQAMQAQGEEKPDPEMAKAQGQLQIAQMTAQANAQLAQEKAKADLQVQREKSQIDVQAGRERAEMEIQMMRDKAAAEMETRRQQAALDAQLRREEMMLEAELTREANQMKAQQQAQANHNSHSLAVEKAKADTNINGVN